MKLIFVDFEMNPISKERRQIRKICPGEIIEIGAVKLDEQAQEISSFKEYVLPKYATEMDETCQELTGITMDMLRQADTFVPAFRRFLDWCNETGENDYEMYAWSENDWRQLHNEMRLKKINTQSDRVAWMMGHWQNFQQIYCNLLGLDNVISLDKAIETTGEPFDGQMHDALWDARNTAKLYMLSKKKEEFRKVMDSIIEVTASAEPLTFSMAEAFKKARR